MSRYDYIHGQRQGALQQQQDTRLVLFGHVSSYDPETHAVKVMIPQYDDEDEQPYLTGWIPLGSLAVGDKFGIQYAPKGGATSEEPGKGEQCQVMLVQRSTGLAQVANLMWTDEHTPPGKGKSDSEEEESGGENEPEKGDSEDPEGLKKLNPGELVIRHESGSFIKFYEDGNVQVYAAQDLKVFAQKNAELTVREEDCTVTIDKGDLLVTVTEGDATMIVKEGDVLLDVAQGNIEAFAEEGDIIIEATMGDMEINCPSGTLVVNAGPGVTVNSTDFVSVIADGIVSVAASEVSVQAGNVSVGSALLQPLVKEQFLLLFDAHTHPAPGGVTGPPTELSNPTDSTTILVAE